MAVAEIRTMCVSAFPLSTTRDEIMRGLEVLVGALANAGVPTEVWVDGSFLTQKVNPEDVDVVLCMQGEAYNNGTQEQRDTVDIVRKVDLKPPLHCHSFAFFEWPESHPLYWDGEWDRAYWIRQFGFSRRDQPKGIARVDIA
jgi:hypothetical protein